MNNVFYFDLTKYTTENNEVKRLQSNLQPLVDCFIGMALPFTVTTTDELKQLAEGGGTYCKKRITDSILPEKIGGFNIKKAVIVDSLELPDWTELNRLAAACRADTYKIRSLAFDGKAVTYPEANQEALKNSYCTFADTPERLRVYKAAQAAETALQELNTAMKTFNGIGFLNCEQVGQLFKVDREKGLQMNGKFFFDNPGTIRPKA